MQCFIPIDRDILTMVCDLAEKAVDMLAENTDEENARYLGQCAQAPEAIAAVRKHVTRSFIAHYNPATAILREDEKAALEKILEARTLAEAKATAREGLSLPPA